MTIFPILDYNDLLVFTLYAAIVDSIVPVPGGDAGTLWKAAFYYRCVVDCYTIVPGMVAGDSVSYNLKHLCGKGSSL